MEMKQILKENADTEMVALLNKFFRCFPKAFINGKNEMIAYPPRNSYFLLDNVSSAIEFKCKVLEWLSYETCSDRTSWRSKKYHQDGICKFFGKKFSQRAFDLIYQKLGNGIRRPLCIKFIESGLKMKTLEEGE